MADWIYLLIGALLLILAVVDALWTTLWIDGSGGPVSSRLTTWAWRLDKKLVGDKHHKLLSVFGPLIVIAIVLMWVLLLWAGWVFIFAAGDVALWDTRNNIPADWSGRIFYVAYTMFTMGNGDFSPKGDLWQIMSSLTNGSGMLLVTLAVTYILSVVSAAVQKRSFASQVLGFARSPDEFVIKGWNGEDFSNLDSLLQSLSANLSTLSEQYRAYPVLQYYHAARLEKSPPMAVAVLDEALHLLQAGVSDDRCRPNPVTMAVARSAVDSFLETIPSAFIRPAAEAPPGPGIDRLRKCGIPVTKEDDFVALTKDQLERRKLLLGIVRNDGWHWPGVSQ